MLDAQGRHITGTLLGPQGLGDTVANVIHATHLDKLAEAYTKITGRDCGCDKRRETLNRLVPYGTKINS